MKEQSSDESQIHSIKKNKIKFEAYSLKVRTELVK